MCGDDDDNNNNNDNRFSLLRDKTYKIIEIVEIIFIYLCLLAIVILLYFNYTAVIKIHCSTNAVLNMTQCSTNAVLNITQEENSHNFSAHIAEFEKIRSDTLLYISSCVKSGMNYKIDNSFEQELSKWYLQLAVFNQSVCNFYRQYTILSNCIHPSANENVLKLLTLTKQMC